MQILCDLTKKLVVRKVETKVYYHTHASKFRRIWNPPLFIYAKIIMKVNSPVDIPKFWDIIAITISLSLYSLFFRMLFPIVASDINIIILNRKTFPLIFSLHKSYLLSLLLSDCHQQVFSIMDFALIGTVE